MATKKYRGHRVSLVIPVDTYEKIQSQAEAENRPIANLCTTIIVDFYNNKEKPKKQY